LKIVPGTPEGQIPLWLEPNPFYGPKDQSQDIRGREMEMKYTGSNLSRYNKLQFDREKQKIIKKTQDPEKEAEKS
jgi:hypothetical protein